MSARGLAIILIVLAASQGPVWFWSVQRERAERASSRRSINVAARQLAADLEKPGRDATETLAEGLAGSDCTAEYFDSEGRLLARYPAATGPAETLERTRLEATIKPILANPAAIGEPRESADSVAIVRSVNWSGAKPSSWLRVSRDMTAAHREIVLARRISWFFTVPAVAVALAIVLGRGREWRRGIGELGKALNGLEQGKTGRPIASEVNGALHPLALIFDAVVPRLEERIERLQRDSRRLSAVLSGMAEGVMAVDARRRLLFANASAYRLFGLDSTAVGRLVPELIRSPQFQQAVESALSGPDPYRGEISLAGPEELPRVQARILSVQGAPLPGAPPAAAVLVFHDVTDLRRLERMRQDFVANASHELKTPLASIKAYTETLLDWGLKDDNVNVRFLKQIDEQADRLNQLVLDLLSLARLESNAGVFHHAPLAIVPVVLDCVESLRGRAEGKSLKYGIDDSETLDESLVVVADEEAIRQILDNLIDNAIKYTPEGGSVRIGCRPAEDREAVVLEVMDSGLGIPRDDLPRIFERFYRVDKARSRELGGTGLGLSIVKHVVQSLGGEITVSSRVGGGSRFTVRIPRRVAVEN